jgi:hypothetical protein
MIAGCAIAARKMLCLREGMRGIVHCTDKFSIDNGAVSAQSERLNPLSCNGCAAADLL